MKTSLLETFFFDAFLGGGIGLSHKVTGKELNELVSQIIKHFNDINNTQVKTIQEFRQIYNALDAVDKDYIQAISASIHATEITSEGVKANQEEIGKIVQRQKLTLQELVKFKSEVNGYTHLKDIDKIWSDLQDLDKKINYLSQSIDNAIKPINAFNITIEQITHLKDVDNMWKDIAGHSLKLSEHENRELELLATIQKNKVEIDNNISDAVRAISDTLGSLTKNIKYLFLIAGGAAGLAIIELILILKKVI